jgi:hypothetical protein
MPTAPTTRRWTSPASAPVQTTLLEIITAVSEVATSAAERIDLVDRVLQRCQARTSGHPVRVDRSVSVSSVPMASRKRHRLPALMRAA